jgi:hypothetical protein
MDEDQELDNLLDAMQIPDKYRRDWRWLSKNLLFRDPPISGRAYQIVMNKMKQRQEDQELDELLDRLDLPEKRRRDLIWLSRNLLINNQSNDGFRADELIRKKLWRR